MRSVPVAFVLDRCNNCWNSSQVGGRNVNVCGFITDLSNLHASVRCHGGAPAKDGSVCRQSANEGDGWKEKKGLFNHGVSILKNRLFPSTAARLKRRNAVCNILSVF